MYPVYVSLTALRSTYRSTEIVISDQGGLEAILVTAIEESGDS